MLFKIFSFKYFSNLKKNFFIIVAIKKLLKIRSHNENFKSYLMVKTDLIYHIPFKNDFKNRQVTHFIANLFNDFCVKK